MEIILSDPGLTLEVGQCFTTGPHVKCQIFELLSYWTMYRCYYEYMTILEVGNKRKESKSIIGGDMRAILVQGLSKCPRQ